MDTTDNAAVVPDRSGDAPLGDPVHVTFTSEFVCRDKAEAQQVTDALIDGVLDVVCPSDPARSATCSNCGGSLVNPPWDGDEPLDPEDPFDREYLPGAPCWVCTPGDTPGRETPCAREHFEGATLQPRSNRVKTMRTEVDRLATMLDALQRGDVTLAVADIEGRLRDLRDDLEFATRDTSEEPSRGSGS